jgi:hypothetical protein
MRSEKVKTLKYRQVRYSFIPIPNGCFQTLNGVIVVCKVTTLAPAGKVVTNLYY